MPQVMEYISQLAETIGPRPATTDAEAQAAEYIEEIFGSRDLEVERQEFECPRTDSWGRVVCGVLVLAAAVLSVWWSLVALPLAIGALALTWLDESGRFSVSRLLSKGPSQNIIARHVPRARRGDRLKHVVIVAHYDSAKPSLLEGPGLVKYLRLFAALSRWVPVAVAAVIAFGALPLAAAWKPWTGYAAIAVAAWCLIPVLTSVHRELLMHATDGANDNASGVAAMLAVMEATVPEQDEAHRMARRPVRRGPIAAQAAGVVDEDVVLEYRSVDADEGSGQMLMALDDLDDVEWAVGAGDTATPAPAASSFEPVTPPAAVVPEQPSYFAEAPQPRAAAADAFVAPESTTADWSASDDLDTMWEESEAPPRREQPLDLPEVRPARPAPEPVSVRWDAAPQVPADWEDEGPAQGQESLELGSEEVEAAPAESSDAPAPESGRPKRGRRDEESDARGMRDWLGIGRGFDVRRAGKEIGSWDNLDNDDEFGFKAGSADALEGADAASIAARIRRQVTDNVDRALAEKEIWFVATGAAGSGNWGMKALLDAYGDDLRDALIINMDTVGSGSLAFVTEEGGASRRLADRRLVAQAKRTARENDLPVRGRITRGHVTDASHAIGRRFRAMSVRSFDINGRLPNWHWHTDTIDAVAESSVAQAAEFVRALVRDL